MALALKRNDATFIELGDTLESTFLFEGKAGECSRVEAYATFECVAVASGSRTEFWKFL